MSEWYSGKSGMVKSGQVKSGQVKSGQVKSPVILSSFYIRQEKAWQESHTGGINRSFIVDSHGI